MLNAAVVFSETTIGSAVGEAIVSAIAADGISAGIVVAVAAMVSICSGVCKGFGLLALSSAAGASFCSAIFFLPPTLL